jgi:DNA-binding NarL/FixJ family response regulator
LFADDHSIVRDGLRSLFRSDPAFTIVAECVDGLDAVEATEKHLPDLAVLDISMPRMNGIEATRSIKEKFPGTRVLILTIHENEEFVLEMIHAGADGYILKNAEKGEILSAAHSVASGQAFFSSGVSKLLVDGIRKTVKDPEAAPGESLTRRETEILRHIAEGMTSREIASQLHISFSTVNSHRSNLMKKLGIHDTAGLVRFAVQRSIIRIPTP